MSTEDFDKALSSAYEEHREAWEEPYEVDEMDLELLHADAAQILSTAMSNASATRLALLVDRQWQRGCGVRVFLMATWMHLVTHSLAMVGERPIVAVGKPDGTVKTVEEMSEGEKALESWTNYYATAALGDGSDTEQSIAEALDRAHKFLHYAEEVEARKMFAGVLFLAANGAKHAMHRHMEREHGIAPAGDGEDLLETIFGHHRDEN